MAYKMKLEKSFFSERDLEDLGLRSRKTSQNLRAAGEDPLPYFKFGRSIRYRLEDVLEYLEKHKTTPRQD